MMSGVRPSGMPVVGLIKPAMGTARLHQVNGANGILAIRFQRRALLATTGIRRETRRHGHSSALNIAVF
jgi:hypothetical protein